MKNMGITNSILEKLIGSLVRTEYLGLLSALKKTLAFLVFGGGGGGGGLETLQTS